MRQIHPTRLYPQGKKTEGFAINTLHDDLFKNFYSTNRKDFTTQPVVIKSESVSRRSYNPVKKKDNSHDNSKLLGMNFEDLQKYHIEGNEKLKQLNEALQKEIANLKTIQLDKIQKNKSENSSLNNRLKEKSDLYEILLKQNGQLKKENETIKDENTKLKSLIEKTKNENALEIKKIKNEFIVLLESSKADIDNLESTKNKLTTQVIKLKAQAAKIKQENYNFKNEIETLKKELFKRQVISSVLCVEKVSDMLLSSDNSFKSSSIMNTEQKHKHSQTEYLLKLIESENNEYSNKLTSLETQLDYYMKNKNKVNTSSCSNCSDNSGNPDNDTQLMLYDFYAKTTGALKGNPIPLSLLSEEKKEFLTTTNTVLDKIKNTFK